MLPIERIPILDGDLNGGGGPATLGEENESRLPPRDWILMPFLGLLTVVLLSVLVEWISAAGFSEGSTSPESCMVFNDPSTGVRALPNCTFSSKGLEGSMVDYSFNRCGHRAGMECGPKTPGVYRIVLIGSSIAEGLYVSRKDSFAALLSGELSQPAGQRIEIYNEGMYFGFSHSQTLRFNDALAQSPDMIFWALTPEDVRSASEILPGLNADPDSKIGRRAKAWRRLKGILNPRSTVGALAELFDRTSTAFMIRHFLFMSENQYLRAYLIPGNEAAAFLLTEPTSGWNDRLLQFDKDAANLEERARAAGVPFVATLVPAREQAAMISTGEWPAGYDPYKVGNQLRTIITSHGGVYLDVLPDFRNIPNPEQYYLPVDGHPTVSGHALIAQILANELNSAALIRH